MKMFFTSDTHFGHTNIIKHYNRPFSSIEEMNEEIVERWNSVVTKKDIVFHLGDIELFNYSHVSIMDYIEKLQFYEIVLIRGNHDRSRTLSLLDRHYGIIAHDYFELKHEGQQHPIVLIL
jgi:calcineurin-like phosphoesterase family protein